jgi:hypothetical protein
LSLSEQIFGPYTGIRDNPAEESQGDNQLLSVFMSWVLRESGFEVYGEYAREDHWEDANDLLMQLDHSRGYTIGLEKVFTLRSGEHLLRVSAEATMLGNAATSQSGRSGATFYVHDQVRQGYTHRGQLLGAPIGPGSDAQYVGVDYLKGKLLGGLYYERVRYDNDTYYRHFAFERVHRGHDAEWTVGARGGHALPNVQITADLGYSTRHNREFVVLLNEDRISREHNLSFTFGAAWIPPAPRSVP